MEDIQEGFHKPHPCGINHIMKIITPPRAYYLGDTPDDMICAKRANITGIGVFTLTRAKI